MVKQKGTFFWHAHVSWLRGTVYGAMIVYPKTRVPYPFNLPYQEHIIILGNLQGAPFGLNLVSHVVCSPYNAIVVS